jgi:tetratricopeptide (TPR) repeat protein
MLHSILEDIDYGEATIIGNIAHVADLECYADNLEANIILSASKNDYLPLYVGNDLSNKQNRYSNLYDVIKDCNIIMDNIEEKESRLAKDVLGTAYALRGICYYNLLRDFCEPPVGNMQGLGVPLVTKFDMEAKPLRSTIENTYKRAEADMLMAISYQIEDPMFRFNTDIMEGYLARLYFWVGNWTKAAEYAGYVLTKYPLLNGSAYTEMLGSEITRKGNILIKGGILTDSNFSMQNSSTKSNLEGRAVSKRFIDVFVEKEADIRYGLSFTKKRVNSKNLFSCLRSAEMQMILAESLYHSESDTEALAALNEFRRNRIEGVEDYTMETLPAVNPNELIKEDVYGNELTPLLNAILNERRKEFYMEGDRWYELKRNGRPEFWAAKQGRKYTTMKFMYTFPLPVGDVELVDGLIQNPGYDKVK